MATDITAFTNLFKVDSTFGALYSDDLSQQKPASVNPPVMPSSPLPDPSPAHRQNRLFQNRLKKSTSLRVVGVKFCNYLYREFVVVHAGELGQTAVINIYLANVYGHWGILLRFGSFVAVRKMDHYDRVFPDWIQGEQGVDSAARELWEQDKINLSVQKREVEAIEQLGNTVPGFDATASQRNVAVASQLTLARTWFMRCLQEHANCGDGTNNQFYPMRLIDVRGASSHLVLPRDANENISRSYATLSHRWTNSDNFSSLTTEKVSHFRNEIPEEHIFPTFRDAINVCKALETPYLWIDSMCILQSGQGSLEDWQSNGSAMAAIYTNSAVNIAADNNENANRVHTGSFHNSTAVEERIPTRLKISGSELVIYPTSMSIGIPKILDKRGWIIQEMLLAPRILRFGQGQMSWECTQNPCAYEAFPAGMRNDIAGLVHREAFVSPQGRDQNRLRNPRKEILRLENALKDPVVNSTEIYGSKLPELFLDCVEVYTNCDLTFPDIDKFMALSGVVSRVSELTKGDYIAGFFRDMLPRALLWKVEKPGSFLTESSRKDIRFIRSQRTQKYRAPTDKAIDFTGCVYHARDRYSHRSNCY